MRGTTPVIVAALALALAVPAPAATTPQGKSNPAAAEKKPAKAKGPPGGQAGTPASGRARDGSQEKARGKAKGQARGRDDQARRQGGPGAGSGAARGGPPAHARGSRGGWRGAPDVDRFNRDLLPRAARVRRERSPAASSLLMHREGGEIRVVRSDGRLLFALDDGSASELGYWRAVVAPAYSEDGRRARRDGRDDGGLGDVIFGGSRYDDPDRRGPPSFCRSGEGHPVWGRQWCVDKGFGLGNGTWATTRDPRNVVFRGSDRDTDLDRGGLIDVLGDIVFGRLAVQSLVLGADEPLVGRWIGDRDGPRILRVQAGDLPVAELIDADRDDDVDAMVFNLGD